MSPKIGEYCLANLTAATIYWDYCVPILCGLTAISIVPFVYIFLRAYARGNLKTTRFLFITTTIFYIVVFGLLLVSGAAYGTYCHDLNLNALLRAIAVDLHSLHTLLLVGILFHRLYIIFKDTSMAISKPTLIFFWTYFLITMLILVVGSILFGFYYYHTITSIMLAICGLLVVTLTVFLVCLFVNKLYITHKRNMSQQNEDGLKHTITKTSLLTLISTCNTIFAYIVIAVWTYIDSIHFSFMRDILIILDMYTNFVCVLLSYKYFDGYYDKLCGKCDNGCDRLWTKIFVDKNQEMINQMSVEVAPTSPSTP